MSTSTFVIHSGYVKHEVAVTDDRPLSMRGLDRMAVEWVSISGASLDCHSSSRSISSLPRFPLSAQLFRPRSVDPFVPLLSCRFFISRMACLCASPTRSLSSMTSSFTASCSGCFFPSAASILSHTSTSYCVTRLIARPLLPARAVRPTRWM